MAGRLAKKKVKEARNARLWAAHITNHNQSGHVNKDVTVL